MSRLLIRGGNRLQGEVTIQGAKNSVLPILAATILTGGSVVLRRCPRLRDVEASIRILQALGCKAGWRGDVLEVDTAGMTGCDVPDALMREMRFSVRPALWVSSLPKTASTRSWPGDWRFRAASPVRAFRVRSAR